MIWRQEIACNKLNVKNPAVAFKNNIIGQYHMAFRLDSLGNVRVGDFGLAEDVYMKGYFRQGKYDVIKLPFKWMAPESLRDGLFSEKSDVVN